MIRTLPVVAAIPNFNMGQQLTELLPTLAQQNYADILVLDDASTDGSREIVEGLDLGVKFIASETNRGAGAARNMINGALGNRALIQFMDADVELETAQAPEIARDIMPSEPVGFVGGLAKTPEGQQSVWNYGPRQCLHTLVLAHTQDRVGKLLADNPSQARQLRDQHSASLADWPDPFSEPQRRQVFWNIEQNLIVDSDVFAGMDGFDERLREHEIQDLAIRMQKHGLPRFFDPSISVRHKDINVRNYNRAAAMGRAELYIARKHGLRNWLSPEGKFKPSL
jgi:GT2 family glycosyltransferase